MIISFLDCSFPSLILIPSSSNISSPLEFRRDQDFFISSRIEFNCNKSFSFQIRWTISNGSNSVMVDPRLVILTMSELFVPSRTLSFGLYQLTLTLTLNVSSNLTRVSQSAYVRINPSGITANLLPLGTSMITRGSKDDLQLNPGLYSVDGDEDQFNAEVNPLSLFFDEWMNICRIGFTNIIVESLACQVFLLWTDHWFPWTISVVGILWILRVWTTEKVKKNENWSKTNRQLLSEWIVVDLCRWSSVIEIFVDYSQWIVSL